MIGIVVWAILIIIIAECASPGLIGVILVCMVAYWAIYFGIKALIYKFKKRR